MSASASAVAATLPIAAQPADPTPGAVVIFTVGTQGDARPCIGLGQSLKRAGYPVRIVTSENFAPLVREAGLEFAAISADFSDLLTNNPETVDKALNPWYLVQHTRAKFAQWAATWAQEARPACKGAALLVGTGIVTQLAKAIGEADGIPFIQAHLQPFTPSRKLSPLSFWSEREFPGAVNMALFSVMKLLAWYTLKPAVNGAIRPQLKLPLFPWYGPFFDKNPERMRVLYGYSRHILPPPDDWPAEVKVTGSWFLDQADVWQPPQALADFLAEGDKPVYFGFGSMLANNAEALTQVVLDAVRLSGRRAVLATGWGGLRCDPGRLNDQVYVIEAAPHDWLFPRMAATVQHGGAGTTVAAARAGVPSVFVPFFGDQPFWARRMHALGAAPPALDRRTVTAEQMAQAVAQALQPERVRAAAELGEKIRAENGGASAVRALTEWGLLPSPRLARETAAPALERVA
ncbi:glycosyltransferase [Lysobacter yananisis]|uniref:Glycosyltransferase n=1 Tax=Lysobacter yananisis TaxID=1003114 RepID=A0ABY9PET7_9GAMM|nr:MULTISPECIES: glycosyltransferase [Lysobacter]UZW61053.1 glycosyltransferase [Lysobacter enzymogenes]WMT04933.1 glycosyltransferase [Lysobacter yananisis]